MLGLALVVVPVTAAPATADIYEECDGKVVEQHGRLVCVGGDSGEPGDDNDDTGPVEEPEEGDKRTGYNYESCTPNNPDPSVEDPGCGGDVQCADDEQPTNIYTRPEVYHRATGWEWTGGGPGTEAGDGWWYQETTCEAPPQPTSADVWAAVKDLAFPGAKAEIQPPKGKTLVGLETNFYIDPEGLELPDDVEVGQVLVELRVTPQEYHWDFDGDGTTDHKSETPGQRYPHTEIVHEYDKVGSYQPSVTIMYDVEWRFGGGDWQGFDTLLAAETSPPTDLQVLEKVSRLGDN